MKHNLLKSVILSVILLMGVTNAWAYNFGDNNGNNQVTIWFDNSTTQLSEIEIHFWQSSGHNVDWAFTHISGTDYWYINTNFANFAGFKIHGKPKNSTDEWGWETNERHDEVHSGWYARCVSPNSANKGSEITWTIPGLKNVNFINTTTAENVLAGAGTNSNPYIIKPATNITVKLTGDLIDNQCSKSYKFGTSNASTTQTYTVNSSATAGSAYNIEGFTGATRDKYTSRYASAGTLYFKTAYNISASVNGGHGTVAITNGGDYVYQGNTTFQLTATPEDGYEVDTWSVSGGTKTVTGNTITITAANNSDVTVSVTFKAKKYIVTLDNQSATTAGTASVQATYGSAMPSATMPQKTGYTFGGYYTAINGGGTQYYNAKGESSNAWNITSNTILYAKWTAKTYNITYKDKGNVAFSGTHASTPPTKHTYGTATTLKTATKTDYTFGGWFTSSDCTGAAVTTLGATAYTSDITLYAKWTEKPKYTVTITSDGNGTVSPNTAQVGEIPVSITATPNSGYKFKNWTKTGNVTIANANNASTTITATGTGKVTANFEKINYIYLKPAGDNKWADGNAIFAIYVGTTWRDMAVDRSNTDIYYYEIPSGLNTVKFGRLNPANKAEVWTETDNLTIELPCNLFDIDAEDKGQEYPSVKTGKWMEYDAWHLVGSFNDWTPCGQQFSQQNDGSYTFTRYLTTGTHSFKLVHNATWYGNNGTMTRGDETVQTGWIMETTADDCKIDADVAGNYTFTFNANTKELTVRYPIFITLNYCEFGTYGIRYNGQTYYAKSTQEEGNLMVGVPYGAEITLIEGKPLSDLYTGDIVNFKTKEILDPNEPIIVTGDITLVDNFVTKNEHDVYLGVPNTCNWDKSDSYANFTWRKDVFGSLGMKNSTDRGTFAFEADAVKYYKFTIPAGCSKFRFQRKQAKDDDSPNTNYTHSQTADHQYMILKTAINCYRLDGKTVTEGNETFYTGYWCELPPAAGDYRLLYVEQVVEKGTGNDSWKTVIRPTYEHPSDIVRKNTEGEPETIVSLHVYKDKQIDGKTCNPEVILQQYNGSKWVDIEAHMVNGPLEAEPGMAMLPGRKKASSDSDVDDFVYDDGIEIIKNDIDKVGRVWNFTIKQFKSPTATENDTATLLLDEDHLKPYEGNYYIRTNNADGGWSNYTIPANHMNHSHYAEANSGYSHYFCKWINTDPSNTIGTHKNVTFVVANDYGIAISDTLAQDAFTDEDGNLKQNTNVRWSWNQYTNEAKRAYIQGSKDAPQDFLTTTITDKNSETNKPLFEDNGNWIYESYIQARVGDKLTAITAPYQGHNQELLEERYQQDGGLVMLTGDENNTNVYDVRVMFDFKINKTTVFLVPNDKVATTAIDVLIERVDHGEATQVKSTGAVSAANQEGYTVHAAMTFTKDNVTGTGKYAGNTEAQRLYYWVSFPFDVRISDVFGFGEYGVHWIMQYYDGEERAKKGAWADSPTYWRYITDTTSVEGQYNTESLNCGILKANQGYVLALALRIADMGVFTHTNQVSLYFPSKNPITNINDGFVETSVTLDEYLCNIERDDRWIKDSNWHLIGVPSYSNKTRTIQDNFLYYYQRVYTNGNYKVTSSGEVNFQSMFSYFVQYAGTIDWTAETWAATAPEQIAAKRTAESNKHTLRVELQQNGTAADQTYITLQEEATPAFDMNKDLTKVINSGSNIYSLITTEATPIEVAGNVMPNNETIIPLGVVSAAAGEYTFAMPDGTDGIIVELIDYETNTRTNMTLDEYTVNLGKGTFETRFALHVKPDKTVTSLEDINTNSDGVRKFIIDGVLYMQKDGALYDAQGKLVR